MANKPVFGMAKCPYCSKGNPVFWNGNFEWKCVYCGKKFKVTRQKLAKVESYKK